LVVWENDKQTTRFYPIGLEGMYCLEKVPDTRSRRATIINPFAGIVNNAKPFTGSRAAALAAAPAAAGPSKGQQGLSAWSPSVGKRMSVGGRFSPRKGGRASLMKANTAKRRASLAADTEGSPKVPVDVSQNDPQARMVV
jgi:hypothetical protein